MEIEPVRRQHVPKRLHIAVPARRAGVPADLIDAGMDILCVWIRDARLRAGMTQAQLARLAGMHQSTLSRLERGRLEGLQLHRLAALIGALDRYGAGRVPRLVS